MLKPPEVDLPEPRPDDVRIGDLLSQRDEPAVVIVGFPSDAGVVLNRGRAGAALGPSAIRNALYRLAPGSDDMAALWKQTVDLGDCDIVGDVGADQETLGAVLGPHIERGTTCIVLGGGHETAYGHFLGHAGVDRTVGIVNVDAHADVRTLVSGSGHSGSSFRQALEHPDCPASSYSVFGLGPHSTSDSTLDFLNEHAGLRVWNHEADPTRFDEIINEGGDYVMVSFDLDVFDQSIAPGVSAPTADGLYRDTGFRIAYSAGVSNNVKSVDISELNPRFDPDGRTARFAAMLIWHFAEGLSDRVGLSRFLRIA